MPRDVLAGPRGSRASPLRALAACDAVRCRSRSPFGSCESTKTRSGFPKIRPWPSRPVSARGHGSASRRHRPGRARPLRGGVAARARGGRDRAHRGAERRAQRGHPPAVRGGARRPSRPTGPFKGVPFVVKDLVCARRATRRTTRGCASCATSASAPTPTRGSRRASARRASCSSARPTRPSSASCRRPSRRPTGPRATRGTRTTRPAARAAARPRPWRRAWCRSGTPATAAARSASRPRAAGWSGLKATRARVSMAPLGDFIGGLATELVVSRSVRDTAAVLEFASEGAPPGEPYFAPARRRGPTPRRSGADPGKLRIGLMTAPPGGSSSRRIRSAWRPPRRRRALLESLGPRGRTWPTRPRSTTRATSRSSWCAGRPAWPPASTSGRDAHRQADHPGRRGADHLGAGRAGLEHTRRPRCVTRDRLRADRGAAAVLAWWQDYDLLLRRRWRCRRAELGDDRHRRTRRTRWRRSSARCPTPRSPPGSTRPASRRSRCRCTESEAGLPIGVQLVGRPGRRGPAAAGGGAARAGAAVGGAAAAGVRGGLAATDQAAQRAAVRARHTPQGRRRSGARQPRGRSPPAGPARSHGLTAAGGRRRRRGVAQELLDRRGDRGGLLGRGCRAAPARCAGAPGAAFRCGSRAG